MTTSIGDAKVALVEYRGHTMWMDAYPTRLVMVLAVINNGAIGGSSSYYGSEEHLRALEQVEQQIAATRAKIAEQVDRITSV